MSTFQPQILGMTAFMAPNRIDFVIDGPGMVKPERCSAFYDNPKAKLKLGSRGLKIEQVTTDEGGEPNGLVVKWGRESIRLGRRQNASGLVSFYRSLESTNAADAPKSGEQIMGALNAFIS